MHLRRLVEVLCAKGGPSIEKGPSIEDGPFQIKSGLRVFGFCPAGSTSAWGRYLEAAYEDVYRVGGYNPRSGFSVRCVRDAE